MAHRTSRVWDCYTDRLLSRGETLAKDYGGNSFPIALKHIASARHVRKVIFRPLLVDGCLTVVNEGFKIYVRCKKEHSDEMRARFESERELGPLPQRMRFTVAHEIAHTLFYRIEQGRPTHPLSITNQKRLGAIERTCNKVAARILLPTELLRSELRSLDPFAPNDLRRLAEKTAVSGPMLVNRIREMGAWTSEIGVIAYIEPEAGVYTFKALFISAIVSKIFPSALIGAPFSCFCSEHQFFPNGGKESQVEFDVKCQTTLGKGIQKFQLLCEDSRSSGRHRGLFVAARRS